MEKEMIPTEEETIKKKIDLNWEFEYKLLIKHQRKFRSLWQALWCK